MEEVEPIAARQESEKHLAELEKFIGSRVHQGFVYARETEIKGLEDAILLNEPLDRKDEIEGFKMRGELRLLRELLTTFEDARQTLKDRIEEMLERENQVTAKGQTE